MKPTQCKMARAGLQLGAEELATLAGVSYPTLNRLEKGEAVSPDTLANVQRALVVAGAQFTNRAGRIGVTIAE